MSLEFTQSGNFGKNMRELGKAFPEIALKSIGKAGLAAIGDAINVNPTPPIDTGNLRGSWFVFAGKSLIGKGGAYGDGDSIPSPSKLTSTIGFSTPYAKYQHEGLAPGPGVVHPLSGKKITLQPGPKSQQAGNVGGKFLEAKLNTRRNNYIEIFVKSLNEGIASVVQRFVL